ncbi:Fumarate reductase subunit [Trichinella spiralis]|uniref:Fumarate reductase subunit n=2 Tax=Trichinella spiralis TaxID=6334 RepID=A0ABR3K8L5_TRISP
MKIMNVSNVAEFRLENSTFVAEEKGRSDDKLKYLAILFGTVTLLTNGILFIMMLLKRPMKKIDKLTAVIAMGSAPLGLAYMISNIQKLVMRSAVRNITSLQCLLIAPQLTLYTFAEPVISYALLLMAMDSFIALMFMNSRWKVDDNNINFYLVLSVILPCICVITLWVVVYYNDRLCADCSIPVVLPQWFFVSFNSVLAFLGYLSVLLFSVAGVGFNLRKSTCTGVRLIQIRRQITILKQTAITVAFSFMIQTVPCTCSVWFAFNKGSPVINQYGWLVCNASYSLYAIYRILRAPAVRRQCQKWFCCKTDQPVASSMVKVGAYSAGEGNKHSSTLPENLCCRRFSFKTLNSVRPCNE